jgi:outer membrane protein TolC
MPFTVRELLAIALMLSCLMGRAAQAQVQDLSLAEAQRLAVERSPQLTANDAALRATDALATAAGRFPDPVLKLGIDNLPVNGPDRLSLSRDFMTMRRIGLAQEITATDKRRLKVDRVNDDARRIRAEREVGIATIRKEAAMAWLDRYYAQATLDLLHEQAEEIRAQIHASETAFRGGRGSQAEVFAARGALGLIDDRLQQAERQVRNAKLMLARWIGGDDAVRPLAPVNRNAYAVDVSDDHRVDRHPQLAVLQAQVKAAETEVRQAHANRNPDWTVEAGYQRRGSAYSDMVSFGVSIPLPLNRANRQDRETLAKGGAAEELRARLADALSVHEAELAVALSDWESASKRTARLTSEVVGAAALRAQATLTTYRAGKSDLAAVLAARRDEIDARLQAVSAEAEVARAWAQVKFLTAQSATIDGSEKP